MTLYFNELFKEKAAEMGFKPINAGDALASWTSFVEECKNGFSWTVFEYFNELGIREMIEDVLHHQAIKSADGYQEFVNQVLTIDECFKEQTLESDFFEGKYWWMRKLPKIGYGDFIESLRQTYKITAVSAVRSRPPG